MTIRNIVFDVGNVLVPWDPLGIERAAFGEARVEAAGFVPPLRGNPVWLAVNRGELSLEEAKALYVAQHGFEPHEIDALWEALYAAFPLITDTRALMDELRGEGYRLFAITDNVHEIVAQLKRDYDFFDMFEAAAVSAELGFLKPDPRIYHWLLETGGIEAGESVFLDDVQRNVDGAKAVGMHACLFTHAARAREDLRALGVSLPEAA
jgi:putative hydrolase of the HAD superfamily